MNQILAPQSRPVRWREMAAYTNYLDRLLNHHAQGKDRDLLLVSDGSGHWWQQLTGGVSLYRLVEQSKRSVLIVREPRWPIRHILMLSRCQENDQIALAWAERLAYAEPAMVSILPIVPALPRLHQMGEYIQTPTDILLSPATLSGAVLEQYARHLQQQGISVRIALHRGEPDTQIRNEVAIHDPDIVLIAAETEPRLVRWLCGELIRPLLRWINRPLLIGKLNL
ncbi:MAG: universal stress protein [Caldilineaceae bacterium]|nr:universal stress protein [Caldilineaceae bacterium]